MTCQLRGEGEDEEEEKRVCVGVFVCLFRVSWRFCDNYQQDRSVVFKKKKV